MKQLIAITSLLALFVMLVSCNQNSAPARHPESEALLNAARGGHADTIRSLLAAPGVDVNATDERGNTALIEAARFGHDDTVRALLAANANVRARNNDGQTALSLATQGGHDSVVRLLRQAGAGE